MGYAQQGVYAHQRAGPADGIVPFTQQGTGRKDKARECENPGNTEVQKQCDEKGFWKS